MFAAPFEVGDISVFPCVEGFIIYNLNNGYYSDTKFGSEGKLWTAFAGLANDEVSKLVYIEK